MRAHRSFTVRPVLPEVLAPLHRLSMNLRWSWDERTRDLFRWVDPESWEETGHDPVRLLGLVGRERLDALGQDPAFVGLMDALDAELDRYLKVPRWFQGRETSPLRSVAYFSPEFGIAEALPQYSGGLGVLAGDHLKAASSLGVPMVGVGLFYKHGYFRQELDADGWQRERYVELDPYAMALSLVEDARVEVDLAGTTVSAQIWKAQVGRVPLYLLDTDVEENDDEGRNVADRLYGGDAEHRLRQELILGVGGIRALDALGLDPQVFHTNEGHAGFLGLERVRRLVATDGLSFAEAIEAVRAGSLFTTHTPVPAGIDRFPRPLMERYFLGWCDEVGVGIGDLLALGHEPDTPDDGPFNMAVMGLRLAGRANGVSRLHGHVSRDMFSGLWPGVEHEEIPISSVTNGVHARTWASREMTDLFDRYVLPEWHEADTERWSRIEDARVEEIWRAREDGRQRLVAFLRSRLRGEARARGVSETDTAWVDDVFDPRVLTIGFARRFASYKRATLLLSQPDRLKALLLDHDRPVQIVYAGKAHPSDDIGKDMIRRIVQFCRQPEVRNRIVFLEDYDIATARALCQGSDVWLNTPRRPLEACGTSGEKAVLNGALHLSIMDGWWDEMFDGDNGWAISSAEAYEDLGRRDEVEAAALFDILERQVVPLFYDRDETGVPRRWAHRIRRSLRTLAPQVSASRMQKDYVCGLYEPTAARVDALAAGNHARVRSLAAWKARVREGWPAVEVVKIDSSTEVADLDAERTVEVTVRLGDLETDDVEVQLVHGPVGPNDELQTPSVSLMSLVALADETSSYRYRGTFVCESAGRYGFAIKVIPSHQDLVTPTELGVPAVSSASS